MKDYCTSQFNFKFQSLAAGEIHSFFVTRTRSFKQNVSHKESSVCSYRECSSNEQCRISINMFRTASLNSFSIWIKLTFRTGKIARRGKLWCRTGGHWRADET
jgi:hypothetical protein